MRNSYKASVALFCLLFLGVAPCHGEGWSGGWQGNLDVGVVSFRVALVLKQDAHGVIRGNFNNIDDGIYDEPLRNVSVQSGKLHADLPTGEVLSLRIHSSDDSLNGTYQQAHGSFQRPGRISEMNLKRGTSFLIPRLNSDGTPQTQYFYQRPQTIPDGWQTTNLSGSHMDAKIIEAGLQKVINGTFPRIHSLVVVHQGKLVMDEYFYGYGPEDLHPIQSETKSVFSTLIGMAQDKGLVNVNQKLYDYFPEYRLDATWQPKKELMTIRDILTMTSGFACDDRNDSQDCSWAMVQSPDWLSFALEEPLDEGPGRRFNYCGVCLTPLGVILKRQSGFSVPDFAKKNLFDPLEIRESHWMQGPNEVTPVSFGLDLRPRDLAKLGYLYLNRGKWKDRSVISEEWIQQSTAPQVFKDETHQPYDYGYLWWEKNIPYQGRVVRMFFAWGVGGQYLFVVPGLDLVCVVTGGNYKNSRLGYNSFHLFQDYVVAAIKDDKIVKMK
jgi:CubicO group peptidase (beta-lactamase class C family)